ncbi:hypothetical protein [Compostibacter hankyongensis]|uniref:Transposase n=1 Tax=Compostibacter hankyongensis TaxID=1007089 RepID=A0ABP8FDX7_9BACT
MQTVTIDILNNKALQLLRALETLKLICMRRGKSLPAVNWAKKYKGAMKKQPLADIDHQLKSLRGRLRHHQ